jgi:hypothetical protein
MKTRKTAEKTEGFRFMSLPDELQLYSLEFLFVVDDEDVQTGGGSDFDDAKGHSKSNHLCVCATLKSKI